MRKISVKVITRARKEGIEVVSANDYKIKVSVPPERGRANERIIEMLSSEFGINKSKIRIVSGLTAARKVVEIDA